MYNKNLITIAQQVQARLTESISSERNYTDEAFCDVIEECVVKEMDNTYMSSEDRRQVTDFVFNAARKLDFIQPFLEDDGITEIMINGPENIFVEREGVMESVHLDITDQKLYEVIQNIVSGANKTVNESSPIVDISLPDGSRANIVLKPLAVNGPYVTVRKFPKTPLTMEKIIENGTVSRELANFLKDIVYEGNNILVSGGTGSGKTTLLNILSEYIPEDQRVITIEDSAELQIRNIKNIVSLEARKKNSEGAGEVTIRELVKTSMRMRPDRIIVGEVRDEAALDMIQALNTGHSGSMSTIHANSAEDALFRLETMALMSEIIPLEAVRCQVASAINIVIHLEKDYRMKRRIKNIIQLCGVEERRIVTREIYSV